MSYTKQNDPWHDYPNRTTPIMAADLDAIEEGIQDAHELLVLEDKVIYVKDTAAGAADGTSWADAFGEISTAVAALSGGRGRIYVDAGTYAAFAVSGRAQIIGIGAVTVAVTGVEVGILMENAATAAGADIVGPVIENILISGTSATTGIRFSGMTRATFRNCRIANHGTGIEFYNTQNRFTERCVVQDVLVNNCGVGLRFVRTSTGAQSFSYNRFLNLAIDACTAGMVIGDDGAGSDIPALYGSTFWGCTVWQQVDGYSVRVNSDMRGVVAHIDLERQAGAATTGWNIGASASNLDLFTVFCTPIGTYSDFVTRDPAVDQHEQFRYILGQEIHVESAAGVGGVAWEYIREGSSYPGLRLMGRNDVGGEAYGKIEFGSGASSALDVELYREQANVLKTPDQFYAVGGINAKAQVAVPADSDFSLDVDGNLAVSTSTGKLYVRINSAFVAVALDSELATDVANLAAHLADTIDAHDADAISYAGNATIAATSVEKALDELDDEKVPLTRTITAGDALSGTGALSADLTLDVKTDGTTIEVASDALRVKDSGITSAKIADLTIVNGDVSASAAIVYSKLNLAASILAADIAASAYIKGRNELMASEQGFTGETFARVAAQASSAPAAGVCVGTAIPLLAGDTITNIHVVQAASSETAVTLFKLGLYAKAGGANSKLAESGNAASALSAGAKPGAISLAMTAAYAVTASALYWLALVMVGGGTSATFIRGPNLSAHNVVVGSGARPSVQLGAGGQTDFPASPSINATGIAYWFAWS